MVIACFIRKVPDAPFIRCDRHNAKPTPSGYATCAMPLHGKENNGNVLGLGQGHSIRVRKSSRFFKPPTYLEPTLGRAGKPPLTDDSARSPLAVYKW